LGSIISGAGTFLCSLYKNYPGWTDPDPTGFASAVKAVVDKLCPSPPPLPIPDVPSIPGGKCKCVGYTVAYTGRVNGSSPFSGTVNVKGPISAVSWKTNPANLLKFGFFYLNDACTQRLEFNVVDNVTADSIASGDTFARIDSITRTDGLPDNCGDQPPIYTPKIPPASALDITIPVVVSPGVTFLTPITIIRPEISLTFSPRVNINFNPTFNLPDLNFNISFDIAGAEINNTININSGSQTYLPDPRTNPPQLPPASGTDLDLSYLYTRINTIIQKEDQLLACACPATPSLNAVTIANLNSGNAVLPPKTKFVVCTITQFPESYKFQSGINAADVVYAGWGWFGYEGAGLGLRDPMDSQRKVYFPQGNPARFQWTLYKDFIMNVVAYYES
jgi:hypothetical protein